MWFNVSGFRRVLGDLAARRMTRRSARDGGAAVVLAGDRGRALLDGRRGSRVGGALFALAALGSLALPLAARGGAVECPLPAVATGRCSAHAVAGR